MVSKQNRSRIRYLSDEQVGKIHERALDILDSCGILVEHEGALELLRDSGAAVDSQKSVVRISPDIVEKCLKSTPHEVLLGARDPAKNLNLQPSPKIPATRNGGGVDNIIDLDTGEFRKMLTSDIVNMFRVLDALDNISYVAPLYAQDMPENVRDVLRC